MVRTRNKMNMTYMIKIVNGQNSVIILLHRREYAGYSFPVAAKSATGRGNPCNVTATQDALSVFFYCRSLSAPAFSGFDPHRIYGGSGGADFGQAGAVATGISTPVRATTNQERGNSGGSKHCFATEIDACQRPLPKLTRNLPGFFLLSAVLICVINLTADKSLHLTITPHAALLRVTLWRHSPVVCLLKRAPINSGPERRT